ncbi:hypothetical protein AALP_AAs52075U000100 [Arabis alpina]|uniref:Uncharacterized protein n=1 Tax=Arabis alpina TaxID=50452 RepID=A0A087G3N6_ARAAL|nr:hypothetical protein AALP_AAs52075U000100 [Arabis alpina]
MVKLNLDVVDCNEELELPKAAPAAGREGRRPEKASIAHGRGKRMMGVSCLIAVEPRRLDSVQGGPDFLSSPRDDASPSDPDARFAMSAISMLAGYNFLCDAWSNQKNRKLNTQNGELVAESNRSKEARCKAEQEVAKFMDLLNHSQQMNGDLIAEHDVLNSKVAALILALAKAEEVKKNEVSRIQGEVAELKSSSKDAVARGVEEAKRRAKDKLRRSLEIMEERSRAQTEVDRLALLASQVVGAIRRMDKVAKEGVPVDVAKKEKLEARLAAYTSEVVVLLPLPVDSSDDEGVEPRRSVALDISSIAPFFSEPDANLEERELEVASLIVCGR